MSGIECRRIIRSVACDRHNMPFTLQCLHKEFLVHRSCTRNDNQFIRTLFQFLVCESSEHYPFNCITVSAVVCPDSNLTCDFLCRVEVVACDDFHLDPGFQALFHGILHVFTDRVLDSHDAHKHEFFCHELTIADSLKFIIHNHIGKSQSTHCLQLIFFQFLLVFLAGVVALDITA